MVIRNIILFYFIFYGSTSSLLGETFEPCNDTYGQQTPTMVLGSSNRMGKEMVITMIGDSDDKVD